MPRRAGLGRLAALLAAAFWAGSSLADATEIGASDTAPGFPKAVYSSDPGCPTTDIHARSEPTLIREDGLEAIEYYCEFARVTPVFDGEGWLVDAVCNEPGFFFPESMVFMVEGRDASGPTTLRQSERADVGAQATLYYRCDD